MTNAIIHQCCQLLTSRQNCSPQRKLLSVPLFECTHLSIHHIPVHALLQVLALIQLFLYHPVCLHTNSSQWSHGIACWHSDSLHHIVAGNRPASRQSPPVQCSTVVLCHRRPVDSTQPRHHLGQCYSSVWKDSPVCQCLVHRKLLCPIHP